MNRLSPHLSETSQHYMHGSPSMPPQPQDVYPAHYNNRLQNSPHPLNPMSSYSSRNINSPGSVEKKEPEDPIEQMQERRPHDFQYQTYADSVNMKDAYESLEHSGGFHPHKHPGIPGHDPYWNLHLESRRLEINMSITSAHLYYHLFCVTYSCF